MDPLGKHIAAAILALFAGANVGARLPAAEPELLPAAPPAIAHPQAKLLGSLSCASATCHGGQGQRAPRQEYARWLAHDPHAKSAETLASPAFRRILALTSSGQENGPADPQVVARCAACHDPVGLAQADGDASSLLSAVPDAGTRGIGCEACHGSAEHWLAKHYEREISRDELAALGMTATKNLLVRGRTCAACHIGDADHDLNHDMLAAGHPPLRFELSAYHDLIRHKHWSDAERIRTPEFKVQLWAAGQTAAIENTLALVESRAARAAKEDKLTPWPEFAEYDCFACHQRLRQVLPRSLAGSKPAPGPPSSDVVSQKPGPGLVPAILVAKFPGLPAWQPWNLAWADAFGRTKHLELLRAEMPQLTALDPARIQGEANAARRAPEPIHLSAAEMLSQIESQADSSEKTWAASCHELLALKAAYLAWRDKHPGEKPAASETYERRLAAVGRSLGFGSREFEWPAFDWNGLPTPGPTVEFESLAAISRELAALASELATEYKAQSAPGLEPPSRP